MKVKFKFKTGTVVKDRLSGFTGTIDAAALWINGCKRYSVQPYSDKGTERLDSYWMDEQNLEFVDEGISKKVKPKPVGGPSFKVTDR